MKELFIQLLLWPLWVIRKVLSADYHPYGLITMNGFQPLLAWIGRVRAQAVFLKAKRTCPAYQKFLQEQKYRHGPLPIMTKENYVKKYSLEERCYYGKMPLTGVVIDESSGSSGKPNNWVRSKEEREDVKQILQLNYKLIYHGGRRVLLNCFALGPWATGMNVSMSLVDVGILKSIGPDRQKLENTLEMFGPQYNFIIFGYPPFIKSFVDDTRLDLKQYKMDLVVGGEGISEGLRNYLLRYFQTVVSSYGASDLEINIGVETDLTIELRRAVSKNNELCKQLFGRENPPMIFQYNALDYVIESNEENELLFTIGRQASAAPKIRYNIKDCGGTKTYKQVKSTLQQYGIDIGRLAKHQSHFPILFVYGRNDLTVPFFGAKIYTSDIQEVIHTHPDLVKQISSFQLSSYEDEKISRKLKIRLEKDKSLARELPGVESLRDIFFDGLCRCNQDFREVSKMFPRSAVEVEIFDFEEGPFKNRDIRVKNKYIG